VNWSSSTEWMRPIAIGAATLLLYLPPGLVHGQRREGRPAARAPIAQNRANPGARRPQAQIPKQQNQGRFQPRPGLGQGQRPQAVYRPGPPPSNSIGNSGTLQRPAYPPAARPGNAYPGYAPPGHLQDWLNQHRNLPLQDQERLLRNDPAFNRQPPAQQQRQMLQLRQLNQMPDQQRQLRLARNEMLERLSPQQRMNLNDASRRFATMPAERKQLMNRAFQDLRSVPPDQRQTVLNSARFQNQFSPDERDILSNFLRVEPYQPPQ